MSRRRWGWALAIGGCLAAYGVWRYICRSRRSPRDDPSPVGDVVANDTNMKAPHSSTTEEELWDRVNSPDRRFVGRGGAWLSDDALAGVANQAVDLGSPPAAVHFHRETPDTPVVQDVNSVVVVQPPHTSPRPVQPA